LNPPADQRGAFRAGFVAIAPVLPSMLPFALIVGAAAVEAGLSPAAALGLSMLVFAGASQLAVIQLFDNGAAAAVMLATALVINLRFAMYSAGLAPLFHAAPARHRALMAYALTDQAFALSSTKMPLELRGSERVAFYAGMSLPMWLLWQSGTLTGALIGAKVPPSWSLDFAVPLMFLGLLLMALKTPPQRVAATVGAAVAVAGHEWLWNSGLIIGALCGVFAGWLTQRLVNLRAREAAR
jgi:predicted branched-subunit amino acid permease